MFRIRAAAAREVFCTDVKSARRLLAMMLHRDSREYAMKPHCPKRPWICRLLTVSVGLALFLFGVRVGDFAGLVLMIVGLAPTIIGAADVSLISEIRDERAHRLEPRRVGVVTHEHRA